MRERRPRREPPHRRCRRRWCAWRWPHSGASLPPPPARAGQAIPRLHSSARSLRSPIVPGRGVTPPVVTSRSAGFPGLSTVETGEEWGCGWAVRWRQGDCGDFRSARGSEPGRKGRQHRPLRPRAGRRRGPAHERDRGAAAGRPRRLRDPRGPGRAGVRRVRATGLRPVREAPVPRWSGSSAATGSGSRRDRACGRRCDLPRAGPSPTSSTAASCSRSSTSATNPGRTRRRRNASRACASSPATCRSSPTRVWPSAGALRARPWARRDRSDQQRSELRARRRSAR